MAQELLRDALERAEGFPPAVRSAALCHIARVLKTSDADAARRVLEQGLALAATLPDEDDRGILLAEGAVLAATIDPARAFEVYSTLTGERRQVLGQMLARMADHGFGAAAADYLLTSGEDIEFPFAMAMHVVGPSDDLENKRRMLRRAIAAMREIDAGRSRKPAFGARDFVHFFVYQWRLLPAEEARAALREQVQRILSEPDAQVNASFGAGSANVAFTSQHQQALFEILEPLQELDPDLAASIIPRYPELSAAAWRFPYGQRSMTEQMERETAAREPEPPPDDTCMDYVHVGGFIPVQEALRTQFGGSFAAAMDEYDTDSDPDDYNEIPQQCWPSAAAFRTILYKAGQYEGAAAARYLGRIPDPALRLFAQIELAASLAGLPQLGSTTMRWGSRARRRTARAAAQAPPSPTEIPPSLRPLPPARKPNLQPSRALRVSPATADPDVGISGGSGGDFIEIRNAPISSVVSHLFEMPAQRIEWPSSIDPAGRWDFVLVLADRMSDEERGRLVREGIASYFNVRVAVEERPKDVWVLTAPNGIKARARRTPSMSGSGGFASTSMALRSNHLSENPRTFDAMRLRQILGEPTHDMARSLGALAAAGASIDGIEGEFSIPDLCAMLEPALDRPLVDETGLGGRYAIAFESHEAGGFLKALTHRLGLVLTEARRVVPTLVVSAA